MTPNVIPFGRGRLSIPLDHEILSQLKGRPYRRFAGNVYWKSTELLQAIV